MCYIFNQLGYIKPSGNEVGCSFFAWPESAMIYFFSYNPYIDTGMIPDFLRRKRLTAQEPGQIRYAESGECGFAMFP